jgi:hypothetical protein
MTELEWRACECPLPMLIFLRGEVPVERKGTLEPRIVSGYGDLFYGPGQLITADQCRRFILRCANRLGELPLDELSRQALAAYRQHVVEGAPRAAFSEACQRIHAVLLSGGTAVVSHLAAVLWTDEPTGAASAAMEIACTIANVEAKESVAITCADATEDDWISWSFCGGPPDPPWQATRAAEERLQAGVLREIIGDPFRAGSGAEPGAAPDWGRPPIRRPTG